MSMPDIFSQLDKYTQSIRQNQELLGDDSKLDGQEKAQKIFDKAVIGGLRDLLRENGIQVGQGEQEILISKEPLLRIDRPVLVAGLRSEDDREWQVPAMYYPIITNDDQIFVLEFLDDQTEFSPDDPVIDDRLIQRSRELSTEVADVIKFLEAGSELDASVKLSYGITTVTSPKETLSVIYLPNEDSGRVFLHSSLNKSGELFQGRLLKLSPQAFAEMLEKSQLKQKAKDI